MQQDDPLWWIKRRLRNWGAWTRADALPQLGVVEPPAFAGYVAAKAWESGWGDPGPPEQAAIPIDERDAEEIESALLLLGRSNRALLRGVYAESRYYPREQLDFACRCLIDRLPFK